MAFLNLVPVAPLPLPLYIFWCEIIRISLVKAFFKEQIAMPIILLMGLMVNDA
jgi:hypothetical protein